MLDLEKYIVNQLKQLVPKADVFEVRANIGDNTYSMEFFATIDGVKHQCYDMIDEGAIKEKDFDTIINQLAKYIRTTSSYSPGEINKISFVSHS